MTLPYSRLNPRRVGQCTESREYFLMSSSIDMELERSDLDKCRLFLLPLELRSRMVSFLSSNDAVRFSQNFPGHGVQVCGLRPIRCLFRHAIWHGDEETGDLPVRSSYRIPVMAGFTHSVNLSLWWKDQGWGNRKGHIYIVASPKERFISSEQQREASSVTATTTTAPPADDHFQGGRLVWQTTELAPHEWEQIELSFSPHDSEVYHIWYSAGSGGGHELYLRDGRLSTFIFDDAQHNRGRHYERLHDLGIVGATMQESLTMPPIFRALRVNEDPHQIGIAAHAGMRLTSTFYPKLLLRVCASLLRQLQAAEKDWCSCDSNGYETAHSETNLDPDLVEFMKEYDIPVTKASLRAVQDIISANMEECNDTQNELLHLQEATAPPEATTAAAPVAIHMVAAVHHNQRPRNLPGGLQVRRLNIPALQPPRIRLIRIGPDANAAAAERPNAEDD
jgi:hypothetical protein